MIQHDCLLSSSGPSDDTDTSDSIISDADHCYARSNVFESRMTIEVNSEEARNVHNQMERQRRSDLNQAYAILKNFVPSIANSDRASKQMVLDKAIEHCEALKGREEAARDQRRLLSSRNEALRKKLALLQSQLTQSTQELDNAHWEIQGW